MLLKIYSNLVQWYIVLFYGWNEVGSGRNLVRMRSEYGRNEVGMRSEFGRNGQNGRNGRNLVGMVGIWLDPLGIWLDLLGMCGLR